MPKLFDLIPGLRLVHCVNAPIAIRELFRNRSCHLIGKLAQVMSDTSDRVLLTPLRSRIRRYSFFISVFLFSRKPHKPRRLLLKVISVTSKLLKRVICNAKTLHRQRRSRGLNSRHLNISSIRRFKHFHRLTTSKSIRTFMYEVITTCWPLGSGWLRLESRHFTYEGRLC